MTNKYSKAACATMPGQSLADGGTVGLWERLKAGNIDKEGSDANKRWGSGSKAEAAADAPAPAPAPREAEPASAPASPPSKADTEYSDYGDAAPSSQTTKSTAAPEPATPKRRTASAPAKSKTTAADASPSAAPSPEYSNENRRTASPSPAPAKKGFYASASDTDPNKGMLDRAGEKIKALLSRSASDTNDANYFTPKRTVKADSNFVNGGLIGAGTANAVTKTELSNPSRVDSALGGGRAHYGKK